MENPNGAHFLKPLLPGFYTQLTIPLGFFSKHIEGNPNQNKWKLKTDASEKEWEVKQEGRRITRGWKDFAIAHDLRICDNVIFKHEGDMVFHVTPFGPSCCEIQYENQPSEASSSISFEYCFLAEVTTSNLQDDKLNLPVEAASSTALNKQCQEAILVNKEGHSWSVHLRFSEAESMYYIKRGWRKLCRENRSTIGDLFVFNVVGDENSSPLLCVCPERKEATEILIKHLSRMSGDVSSSSQAN